MCDIPPATLHQRKFNTQTVAPPPSPSPAAAVTTPGPKAVEALYGPCLPPSHIWLIRILPALHCVLLQRRCCGAARTCLTRFSAAEKLRRLFGALPFRYMVVFSYYFISSFRPLFFAFNSDFFLLIYLFSSFHYHK